MGDVLSGVLLEGGVCNMVTLDSKLLDSRKLYKVIYSRLRLCEVIYSRMLDKKVCSERVEL